MLFAFFPLSLHIPEQSYYRALVSWLGGFVFICLWAGEALLPYANIDIQAFFGGLLATSRLYTNELFQPWQLWTAPLLCDHFIHGLLGLVAWFICAPALERNIGNIGMATLITVLLPLGPALTLTMHAPYHDMGPSIFALALLGMCAGRLGTPALRIITLAWWMSTITVRFRMVNLLIPLCVCMLLFIADILIRVFQHNLPIGDASMAIGIGTATVIISWLALTPLPQHLAMILRK